MNSPKNAPTRPALIACPRARRLDAGGTERSADPCRSPGALRSGTASIDLTIGGLIPYMIP